MITEKDIMRIANLAKLQINEIEMPFYIKEMAKVLSFAESVDAALENIEAEENLPVDFSMLRADEISSSFNSEEVLSNTADREENYFKLRKRA